MGMVPFDSAVSKELLVITGTGKSDWLLGDAADDAFDWLLGFSIELTLLRFVLARWAALVVVTSFTSNSVESELDPSSIAVTVLSPIVEASGTVKLAKNPPLLLVVTGDGRSGGATALRGRGRGKMD